MSCDPKAPPTDPSTQLRAKQPEISHLVNSTLILARRLQSRQSNPTSDHNPAAHGKCEVANVLMSLAMRSAELQDATPLGIKDACMATRKAGCGNVA